MSGLTRKMIGALLATAAAVAAPAAIALDGQLPQAGVDSPGTRRISMGVGKSIIIDLPRDAGEVVVGNPKVANAVVRSPRKLYIMGSDSGQTTIFALDRDGRQIVNLELSIGRDVGDLGPLLKAALPKSNITPRTVNDTIILTGTVSSPGEALRAVDIAKGFANKAAIALNGGGAPGAGTGPASGSSSSGGVVNALTVLGEDQVMLKVTVAEVERKVLKQLGVSSTIGGDTLLKGSWGSFSQENPFAVNPTIGSGALQFKGSNGTTATLKAFERYGVSRTLAEPTVTAVSGESAKLIVGGEIPVPSTGSCNVGAAGGFFCTPGITFKPYGVSLNFIPIVMAEGRIQLRVNTEVTEVDLQNTFTYNNLSIPGFKTRKNETTVELPSGGSIATAGLLTQKSAQAINGLPGLINLPVLGALFRSRDYLRDETELLVIVTPYIAKAVSSREITRPDDGFADASDPQAWLLGRVNRIYSSRNNPQLIQNLKGRIGFIHD